MKKRIIAVLMCAAMALTVVGCGGGANGGAAAGKGLKIAIVSSPSGVDDGSVNQENYNGILSFIDAHPDATVTPVQETTGDTAACIKAVSDIVADYDAIVCYGFHFASISDIAKDNPDKKFIRVDTDPKDAEGKEI